MSDVRTIWTSCKPLKLGQESEACFDSCIGRGNGDPATSGRKSLFPRNISPFRSQPSIGTGYRDHIHLCIRSSPQTSLIHAERDAQNGRQQTIAARTKPFFCISFRKKSTKQSYTPYRSREASAFFSIFSSAKTYLLKRRSRLQHTAYCDMPVNTFCQLLQKKSVPTCSSTARHPQAHHTKDDSEPGCRVYGKNKREENVCRYAC